MTPDEARQLAAAIIALTARDDRDAVAELLDAEHALMFGLFEWTELLTALAIQTVAAVRHHERDHHRRDPEALLQAFPLRVAERDAE